MKILSVTVSLLIGLYAAPFMATAADEGATGRALAEEEIVIEARRNLSRQIKRGFAAFRAGEFKKAESYFYRVRAGHQLNASITFQEFNDMWSINSVTGAREVYTSHGDAEVRKALAIIHYMEGMSQLGQGETMSARLSFKRAVQMNPRHFDARADLALIEIDRGKALKIEKHIKRLAKDLSKCDTERTAETCAALQERLWQVEAAYGRALNS